MAFFVEYFYVLLVFVGILSLLFFRMVRNGIMVYAEVWRNLSSLLLAICGLFLLAWDLYTIHDGIYVHLFNGALVALLLPSCYLILKFIFAPVYFSASRESLDGKLDRIYVGMGNVERYMLQFAGLLAAMLSMLVLIELFGHFDWKLFIVSIILLLAGSLLMVIRNTLHAEILTNIAITHLSRGNVEKSNALLQESLLYKRDLPKTWAMLTEVHRRMGDWDSAKRYLAYLKRIRPSSALTATMETKLDYSMEKYAKCVKTIRRELDRHPGLSELLVLGGKASAAMGEHAQSLEFFVPFFNEGGHDPEARCQMIKAYFKTKQYENAVKEFEKLESKEDASVVPGLLKDSKRYHDRSLRLLKKKRGVKVD